MSLVKQIISSTAQLTITNAVLRLISLLTLPLLTSFLTPEAYGISALVGTMVSLIAVIALSGMEMSYVRSYHAQKTLFEKNSVECFAWRFAIGATLLAGLASVLIWKLIAVRLLELPEYLTGIVTIGVILSLINTMAQARARIKSQQRKMVNALLVSGILSPAITVFLAWAWRQDELPLIIGALSASLITLLMLGIPSITMLSKESGLTKLQREAIIRIGLSGVLTSPLFWVITSMDKWMLGYYLGPYPVGIYSLGASVATMGYMLNNALTWSWLPEVSKAYEDNQTTAKQQLGRLSGILIAALALVWLLITMLGGDAIRLLAEKRFHAAADIVPYIAGAVFFHGVLHIANAGLFVKSKLHYGLWWWTAGGVMCVIFNVMIIPVMGMLGAAIVQLCSMALISLGILFVSQRLFGINMQYLRLLVMLTTIFICGLIFREQWSQSALISILSKIPVVIFIAILLLRHAVGNELFHVYLRKFKPW